MLKGEFTQDTQNPVNGIIISLPKKIVEEIIVPFTLLSQKIDLLEKEKRFAENDFEILSDHSDRVVKFVEELPHYVDRKFSKNKVKAIAHSINNPLTVIMNCIQRLKKRELTQEARETVYLKLKRNIKRVDDYLRELLHNSETECWALASAEIEKGTAGIERGE